MAINELFTCAARCAIFRARTVVPSRAMNELERRRQFLVQTPFFGGLDGASLDRVIGMLVERCYDAGALVFREGEQGRSMFIVHEGELFQSQSGESGRQVKLMRLNPGDFFGET